jgi:transcriptional regulator with XRE-family HTH domain
LSQEELGEKAGFHYTYIGGVERGQKNPSIETLQKIANALGANLFELLPVASKSHDDSLKAHLIKDVDELSPKLLKAVAKLIRGINESGASIGKQPKRGR